jgi:putative ATP-dependent endonuclease of the OLD family
MEINLSLNSFGIKNFRGIGEQGIYLTHIKKINLFIGKNNSGKSNILKFINQLSQAKGDFQNFPQTIENRHKRTDIPTSIFFNIPLTELNFPKDYVYATQHYQNMRIKYVDDLVSDRLYLEYFISKKQLTFSKEFDSMVAAATNNLSNHFNYSSRSNDARPETNSFFKRIVEGQLLSFFKDIIYIPDFRFIKEGVNIAETNSEINGSNIISQMFVMQNPTIGQEEKRKQFLQIRDTIRELLGLQNLEIEIPHTKDHIILEIEGNRLTLEYFGTGIHELVILCCALIIHNNHIVCLEEPEIHLHPELQKKFFEFLLTTKNRYFITTHSNSFLDYSNNDNVAIYHVINQSGKSQITYCNTNKHSYEILNDLGYQASDLLHANGIIWVEGPSDRTFIKKWINLKNATLKEGIHYSIMFYGGKILSHFSGDTEYVGEDLISLFKFNRNAFVIIDSDIAGSRSRINKTKQRINSEIGENHCWITKGKEIENYLNENTIKKWLKTKYGKDVKIVFKQDNILGNILEKKTINIKYSKAKAIYSKEIVEFIELDDLKILDLEKNINLLVRAIERWNKKEVLRNS